MLVVTTADKGSGDKIIDAAGASINSSLCVWCSS